jgi:hypothetical protein
MNDNNQVVRPRRFFRIGTEASPGRDHKSLRNSAALRSVRIGLVTDDS